MHIKAKKRLGQNFLYDKNILAKIAGALDIIPSSSIVEIGAGTGLLTERLAAFGNKVFAFELDKGLCKVLKEKFNGQRHVEIIQGDFLKADFSRLFGAQFPVTVVGNIPYYISSPIIERIIRGAAGIRSSYVTVQKEFAERIAASAGTKAYGSFTCFVQYYAHAKILFDISRGCFQPAPKVDSCLVRIIPKKEEELVLVDRDKLFISIRTAFGQRRKTLRNSLKELYTASDIEAFCREQNISVNARPETLTLHDFIILTNYFSAKKS
ncbi:MAG TPA: 16S rRNA (adenine(1518)-N(6)/adenine(1519)-N(6))-dimethyltransferase RsmA [Candidatus Omnitrophota bacterium]|nr:16S rRNA (adenine(1518)-N(6)/adenine(1519)-N(6))-dimethyltransferase RsmA [Candidatus Omnitrophota bacterium]